MKLPNKPATAGHLRVGVMEAPQHITEDIDYVVALDLGSETMAAHFHSEVPVPGRRSDGAVSLQHLAHQLVQIHYPQTGPSTPAQPEVLTEADNSTSARMRSRIGLVPRTRPSALPESHAHADLPQDYDKNFFRYFFLRGILSGADLLLPNLKVLFQLGNSGLLPEVEAEGGGTVHRDAANWLCHLTLQVIKNFVLKAPELAGVPRERIMVVITVPNVYSVSHVAALRTFLQKALRVAKVATLYESDAIAYYVRTTHTRAPGPVQDFIDRFQTQIIETAGYVQLLTFDVGRGTTDLSLIHFTRAEDALPAMDGHPGVIQEFHQVIARTGVADGGNRLTYIFARFFDERLRIAFKDNRADFGRGLPPFSFVTREDTLPSAAQMVATQALEKYIGELKASVKGDYSIDTAKFPRARQRELLRVVFRYIHGELPVRDRHGRDRLSLDQFTATLEPYFLLDSIGTPLPSRATASPASGGLFNRMRDSVTKTVGRTSGRSPVNREAEDDEAASAPKTTSQPQTDIDRLQLDIHSYIESNILRQVCELGRMALKEAGQPVPRVNNGESFSQAAPRLLRAVKPIFEEKVQLYGLRPRRSWVVIGGQASQFGPLRAELEDLFLNFFQIPKEQVCFLDGPLAKEACCQGAVDRFRNPAILLRPNRIHGTYGLVNEVPGPDDPRFHLLDLQLSPDGSMRSVVHVPQNRGRDLVYLPRVWVPGERDPHSDHGDVAQVHRCRQALTYTLEYRHTGGVPTMTVNSVPVNMAGFGDTYNNLWERVWPEMLPEAADLPPRADLPMPPGTANRRAPAPVQPTTPQAASGHPASSNQPASQPASAQSDSQPRPPSRPAPLLPPEENRSSPAQSESWRDNYNPGGFREEAFPESQSGQPNFDDSDDDLPPFRPLPLPGPDGN